MTDLSEAVCEKCGAGVQEGEDGEIVCTGCNKSTSMCDCAGGPPTTSEPPERQGQEDEGPEG
jgi:hypothetical protein